MLDVDIQVTSPCQLKVRAQSESLITGVLGTSGAGKTTLLRSLCGLHSHCGQVELNGRAIQGLKTHQKPMTLVQQHTQLIPHWTVQQHIDKTRHPDCPLDTQQLVTDLGVASLLSNKPHQLSGGQKQRVALLLGLLRAPQLLLLDEPFTALDETGKRALFPVLIDALQQLSAQALMVSHQIRDIASLCDAVWELDDAGQVQQHPVQEGLRRYQGNRHHDVLLSARYLGLDQRHQLLRSQIGDQTLVATGQCPYPKDTLLRLAISADDVGLSLDAQHNSSFANDLSARVVQIERDDYGALIHCQLGDQTIQAHITEFSLQRLSIVEDQSIRLVFKAGAVDLLGADHS